MTVCPVCSGRFSRGDYKALSSHFISNAKMSDADHIRWLNHNITKKKATEDELEKMLKSYYDVSEEGLAKWIKGRFVRKFYGDHPHEFMVRMQNPDRSILIGYAIEHHHFLKQWVKSCAYIIAKTDFEDVQRYELDNIMVEFHGYGKDEPSHHELLIRMGEALGVSGDEIYNSTPLSKTEDSIRIWNEIARDFHWLEAMAAMHSLELIASRRLPEMGASIRYFNPDLLEDSNFPESAKRFLREGYEADAGHSEEALKIIEKYAEMLEMTEEVQSSFLRSIDAFDRYLDARLERAKEYENKL